VVVVPGGGPFADQVRSSQASLGFDDTAAHRMAVLAMAQTACVFQSWCPVWQLGHTPGELQALCGAGQPALWCPTVLPDTPASWHITSDSLAAWLALQLAAQQLWLVKSRPPHSAEPSGWAAEGLVDVAFPAYAAAFGGPVRVLSALAELPGHDAPR